MVPLQRSLGMWEVLHLIHASQPGSPDVRCISLIPDPSLNTDGACHLGSLDHTWWSHPARMNQVIHHWCEANHQTMVIGFTGYPIVQLSQTVQQLENWDSVTSMECLCFFCVSEVLLQGRELHLKSWLKEASIHSTTRHFLPSSNRCCMSSTDDKQ